MSKHKLAFRIGTAFGLLLLAILGTGSLTVMGMVHIASLGKDLYSHPFAVTNAALEAQTDIALLRNTMLRAVYAPDQAQIDALLDEADRLDAHIHGHLAVIEQSFLGDRGRVSEARRLMDQWSAYRNQVADEARAGHHAEAARMALNGGAEHYDQVTEIMNYVVAFARNKAASYVSEAEISLKTWSICIGAAVTVAVVMTLAFATSLARTTLPCLWALRQAMIALAEGDMDTEIPLREESDELGDIARDLHTLKSHMLARLAAEGASRLLAEALNQSSNMVMITDFNGTLIYVNPRFTHLTGYSAEEAIGKTPAMLRSEETDPDIYPELWKVILSGQEWHSEIQDRRKNGTPFWAQVSISPIREPSGKISHFVSTHEDITERKMALREVIAAREQAEIANSAKSEMLANMSHELRTPLNAIIGFSEVMVSQLFGPLSDQYLGYATDIHQSGEHLLALINDILDVSAIEAGKIPLNEEEVDVERAVATTFKLIRARADQGEISLRSTIAPEASRVRADDRRFRQILINLLSNAVKFTPKGGSVDVNALLQDGRVTLRVTDTGIGMDEKGIQTALSPFGQIDSAYARTEHGTGLGLPLISGLAELHGGGMTIASKPGQGTTVTVWLSADRTLPMEAAI